MDLKIPFTDIDVGADINNSMLMSLVSKRHTVPQIFFNDDHIRGADELKSLGRETIESHAQLRKLIEHQDSGPCTTTFPLRLP